MGSDAAFTGFKNDEIVKLSKEAEAALDPEKRRALYYDLQKIAMDESPQLWLFHPTNRWATHKGVEGFSVFNTGLHGSGRCGRVNNSPADASTIVDCQRNKLICGWLWPGMSLLTCQATGVCVIGPPPGDSGRRLGWGVDRWIRLRYIGKRLLHTLPVLFGIVLAVFLMVRLIPGDPVLGDPGDACDAGEDGATAGATGAGSADLATVLCISGECAAGGPGQFDRVPAAGVRVGTGTDAGDAVPGGVCDGLVAA